MRRHLWTLANGLMLLMFLFSVAVQFNDPDPLAWMAIYGIAAVICGIEIGRRTPFWAPVAVALTGLVWAATLYSRAHAVPISSLFAGWEMRNVSVEEAREMYGLLVVAVWMIPIGTAAYLRARRKNNP